MTSIDNVIQVQDMGRDMGQIQLVGREVFRRMSRTLMDLIDCFPNRWYILHSTFYWDAILYWSENDQDI